MGEGRERGVPWEERERWTLIEVYGGRVSVRRGEKYLCHLCNALLCILQQRQGGPKPARGVGGVCFHGNTQDSDEHEMGSAVGRTTSNLAKKLLHLQK